MLRQKSGIFPTIQIIKILPRSYNGSDTQIFYDPAIVVALFLYKLLL